MDNIIDSLDRIDAYNLHRAFESAHKWIRTNDKNSLFNLFDTWYRNNDIRDFMKACCQQKYKRVYLPIIDGKCAEDLSSAIKGNTFRLADCKARNWYSDKKYAYRVAEDAVCSNKADKAIVGTHLVPNKYIIFDYNDVIESIRGYGIKHFSADESFNESIQSLVNEDWSHNGSVIVVDGEQNRCEIEEIFSLTTDYKGLDKQIYDEVKSLLNF